MLSMTDADTTVSFATPDDVRQASEKALHIWIGAFSPLWAPFMAATAAGLGFWSMSQAAQRSFGFAGAEMLAPDTHLFAKWPGFALPFSTPWSRGWAETAEDVDRIAELTHDSLSAPIQIAFEAEEKLEQAIEDAIITAHESLAALTPKTDDLFAVTETANRGAAEAVTSVAAVSADAAEDAMDTAVNQTEKAADAVKTGAVEAEAVAKTGVEQTKKVSGAAMKSARAVIDPVSETPVVPSVAEATAEKPPLPLTDVSPALAPRKPRKPKA